MLLACWVFYILENTAEDEDEEDSEEDVVEDKARSKAGTSQQVSIVTLDGGNHKVKPLKDVPL